jgi:hypothetical protein
MTQTERDRIFTTALQQLRAEIADRREAERERAWQASVRLSVQVSGKAA